MPRTGITLNARTMCQLICKGVDLNRTLFHNHIIPLERNFLCSTLPFVPCAVCCRFLALRHSLGSGRNISVDEFLAVRGKLIEAAAG